jgi:DNA invertase Pin-like site-specific DNA recombinase
MKVIGYVRVSTNEQAENGVSLAAQKHRIREYCKANGWTCVAILADDGYSGKDLRRPALQRFLAGMVTKKAPIGALVVSKLDRLTRSVRDLIRLTELLLKQSIALVSIQEAVDTSTATGKMFYTLVTVVSEWERGVIGERTREALAHKRRNGERIGSIPYGFTLARDGKHLVPVPAEGKVLALIGKERAKGLSYGLIADGLNADRIPTKGGGQWHAMTVRSVLATVRRREAGGAPKAQDQRAGQAGGPQARSRRAA